MAKRSSLRASDADRERVAERLREAAAEGRLLAHELEERLATALRARTYGELDAVVEDLPGSPAVLGGGSRRGSRGRDLLRAQPTLAVAVLVAFTIVAAVLAAVAFFASGAWIAFLIVGLIFRSRMHGSRYGYRYRHH